MSSLALSTGRIDRKIEFPLPDEKTKRRIFGIHTGRMTLAEDVDLEELIMAKDDLSGADIKVRVGIVVLLGTYISLCPSSTCLVCVFAFIAFIFARTFLRLWRPCLKSFAKEYATLCADEALFLFFLSHRRCAPRLVCWRCVSAA